MTFIPVPDRRRYGLVNAACVYGCCMYWGEEGEKEGG
jgi:hypothetical protein